MPRRSFDVGGLKRLVQLEPEAMACRFRSHPGQLCEALVLYEQVVGRNKPDEVLKRVVQAINILNPVALERFLRELTRDPTYLSKMSATALAVVGIVLGGVGEFELTSEVARQAISSGSSAFTDLVAIGRKSSGKNRERVLAAFSGFILSCLSQGLLPLPFSAGGRARLKTSRIDDPKGVIELKGLEWALPGATPDDVKWLCAVVDATLAATKMPEEGLEVVRSVGERAGEVMSEVSLLWREIGRAVGNGQGRSLKRWVPPDGLMEVRFDLPGCTCHQLGYQLTRLYPRMEQFPVVDLEFDCWHFTNLRKVNSTIGEDGLLDLLGQHERGSIQWCLMALINQALVRELHRVAFAAAYCNNADKSAKAENNGGGMAVLPHLVDLRRCGRNPSEKALERARACGFAPPPGYTFAMSPPLKCRSTHPDVKPRVVELTLGA